MIDCIAVVSGGMDSITLLYYLVKRKGRKPALLTFSYGQKHSRETECVQYHAKRLGCPEPTVIDLSSLAPAFASSALVSPELPVPDMAAIAGHPQPPTYVPNRNMILLAVSVAYAETRAVGEVYYGAQRSDLVGYWDTTPEFVERMNTLLRLNRRCVVQVKAPFVFYSKTDIVRLGFELGVDYAKTWSCFRGEPLACGTCPACTERLAAFDEMGMHDPLPYAVQPTT